MAIATSPWTVLDAYIPALSNGLDRATAQLSKDTRLIASAAADQVRTQQAEKWTCRNRLFGVAVLGSQGADPMLALPVAVVSMLWWAGAEALDDLADGYASGKLDGAMLAAMPASITNLAVLPLDYIEAQDVTPAQKSLWRRELLWSSRLAAEGQLAEASPVDIVGREQVLAGYRGKTGAAYARDAVMAAGIHRPDTTGGQAIGRWREFGMLYGILRQLHNDNSDDAAEDNEDLANHTPTLRLAHAFSTSGAQQRRRLVRLRQAARTDPAARLRLHRILTSEPVTASYQRDVRGIHHQACLLLDALCASGPFRNVLRAGLDIATICAIKSHDPVSRLDIELPS
jgi:hypothetical protein